MGASRGFEVFSSLWALAIFMHLCTHVAWFLTPFHVLLSASTVFTLLRPSSRLGAVAVNAFLLAVYAWESPATPNHLVLFAAVALSVLVSLATVMVSDRTLSRVDRARWFETFAPVVRVELLVLYFFAVLHKLNYGYFDPQTSCAVAIFRQSAPVWLSQAVLPHEPLRWGLMVGSLSLETAIPLLLWLRPTRPLGLLLGCAFHAFLGSDYPAFSTGLFAIYSLFVPLAFWEGLPSGRAALLTWGPFAFSQLFAVAYYLHVAVQPTPELAVRLYGAVLATWAIATAAALVWLLFARGGWLGVRSAEPGGRAPRAGLWLLPALLFFHGASPYLGLRTVPAFSMFSNLRTEGGRNNHLFLPDVALRIAHYQEDVVTIEDSSVPLLRRHAREGTRLTWYRLRMLVQQAADLGAEDIRLVYRRGGRRREVANAERDPELMERPSWIERKWLDFREIPARNRCRW